MDNTNIYVPKPLPELSDKTLKVIENYLDETKNTIIIMKGKGKKPCRRTSCIKAQRMFHSWPTWALAVMIGVQAAGEQQGHSMNDDFASRLHCAWSLRWDPSGSGCP